MTQDTQSTEGLEAMSTGETSEQAAPAEKTLEQIMADKQAAHEQEVLRKAQEKLDKKAKSDAEKAEAKAKKAQEKADAKAAKDALKAKEKQEKATKVKDEKNGIARPGSGVTLAVWVKADELSKQLKAPVDRATLTEILRGSIEVGTIHTQYGRWRKYYGLTETRDERRTRLEKVREAKEQAKAAAKAEKDAALAAAQVAQQQPVQAAEAPVPAPDQTQPEAEAAAQ